MDLVRKQGGAFIGILHWLVLLSFGTPLVIFGVYAVILLYYSRGPDPRSAHPDGTIRRETPRVSVVIPTHNEERTISKRIENCLASKYPAEKLELVLVDDSNDRTASIVREYSEKFPNIRLIRFKERMGYSTCVIAGCRSAGGELVILGDAGSFPDTDAIPNMVRHFSVPDIGAVTGQDVIINTDEEVGRSEQLYQRIYNFVRTAETNMDSTFYVKGEAAAVRRDLILDLTNCEASFDTAMALSVRQKGYRVIFAPEVKFYEYAPSTHSGRIQQKVIRAANLIKVLFRFRGMVFKRKYGKFGFIILPLNIGMLVVTPVSILAGMISLTMLTLVDLTYASVIWAALGFSLAFLVVFSRSTVSTLIEFEYSLLRAIYQVVFTKAEHDKIEQVVSTRR